MNQDLREEIERDFRRWSALQKLTVERGATEAEAATAAELAARLDAKWNFRQRIEEARARQARQAQFVQIIFFQNGF